jgi:hypothetical protein
METNNRYTQHEWNTENTRYYCWQNGHGHYWADMEVLGSSGKWFRIILRNSNPFKTLTGAIRFIEKEKARIESRTRNK